VSTEPTWEIGGPTAPTAEVHRLGDKIGDDGDVTTWVGGNGRRDVNGTAPRQNDFMSGKGRACTTMQISPKEKWFGELRTKQNLTINKYDELKLTLSTK
jgi:hypothetical protein